MQEIIYTPEDAGSEFMSGKGKISKIRKYHLTDDELKTSRARWLKEIDNVSQSLKDKANSYFFNPYRKGIYYYQIQTLFLLGSNEWHNLTDIINKLEAYTSGIKLRQSIVRTKGFHTAWDKFRGKSSRDFAISSKDYVGRIQENFIMLQRLSRMNPYGYKLHQVRSAIDTRRENREGFEQGVYSYRLSTYKSKKKAFPIKDFSSFVFPKHEGRYISRKFIGTIKTMNRTIVDGKVVI